jgi:DNA-binding response OmpR family regulator
MREHSIPTDALESGKRRVLIVDDDPGIVELLTDVLTEGGKFECRAVNNGFEAGKQANEYHPDLIILDIMLPDINGKAVCEAIRRDPNLTDIKIICISGMVEEDKISELMAAGADSFMHKPLDIDALKTKIADLLDMSYEEMTI